MPTSPRDAIKRRLDQAIGHVETIQGYLMQNGEVYREHHPEIVSQYETVFAFFEEAKNLLISLRQTY